MNINYDLFAHGIIGSRSKDKTPPPPITNFKASVNQELQISLTWDNPIDTDFVGLRIQRKEGSYPKSITDGDTVFNGVSNIYIDKYMEVDVEYYYRIFTYDYDNNFNTDTTQQTVGIAVDIPRIYGVEINDMNSNPESCVEYTDDAYYMNPGSINWDNVHPFNKIKPFLIKDGLEIVELNKDNFNEDVYGNQIDISSGISGDVMIRFPKIWWKMYKEGGNQYVKYANKQIDSTWKALAHINSRTGVDCDYVYISAYLGYSEGGRLRSLSDKTPTVSTALSDFRTQAQANGTNYNQIGFYQLTMLQILYLIRYKNLDSQTALGRGYVDGNSAKTNTGGTNSKGMYYGETTGKIQMKFAGLEDFWGNCHYYIDGFRTNSSNAIQITTKDFNNAGTGATVYPSGIDDTVGYMSEIQGTTETGFTIKTTGGSTTTRYSDYADLFGDCFAVFGGNSGNASDAGVFQLRVRYGPSGNSNFAARFALFK